MRKTLIKVYATILSFGFLYYILIQYCGLSFPCFYNKYLGIQCAGCGITRMFLSILRFDFYDAFMFHPVVFILLIIWNVVALFLFIGKPRFFKKPILLWILFIVSVISLISFGIIRNFY